MKRYFPPMTLPSQWLHNHHWIRRDIYQYDLGGRIIGGCLLGAIRAAIHDKQEYDAFVAMMNHRIQTVYPPWQQASIATFNDDILKNKHEAIMVLQYFEKQFYCQYNEEGEKRNG